MLKNHEVIRDGKVILQCNKLDAEQVITLWRDIDYLSGTTAEDCDSRTIYRKIEVYEVVRNDEVVFTGSHDTAYDIVNKYHQIDAIVNVYSTTFLREKKEEKEDKPDNQNKFNSTGFSVELGEVCHKYGVKLTQDQDLDGGLMFYSNLLSRVDDDGEIIYFLKS